ncbi:MAG TPA: hypothetical protein VLM76_06345 [Patescibacteria group bacterium]|nr:hypothetical protein [Patescibacteria group bacterium]
MSEVWNRVGDEDVKSEPGEPERREPARYDDPDEEAMRRAIERFRRAIEHASACSDEAVQAHAEASAARALWFPRLAATIADASRIHEERRAAFAALTGQGGRGPGIVAAAEALDQAQARLDALRRHRDDALRGESNRAAIIESARRVEEAARSREWHKGSAALPPPDDWREVG